MCICDANGPSSSKVPIARTLERPARHRLHAGTAMADWRKWPSLQSPCESSCLIKAVLRLNKNTRRCPMLNSEHNAVGNGVITVQGCN